MLRLSPLHAIRAATRNTPRRHFSQSALRPRIPVARQVAFAIGTAGSAFVAAALLTNKDAEDRRQDRGGWWSRKDWRGLDPELASSRLREVVQRTRRMVNAFGDDWRFPTIIGQSYINLHESQRTQLAILAVTSGVFVLWNIPVARGFASRYLWHDPLAGRPITLITSVFAHRSLPHFAFNSIALWSIGSACHSYFDHHDDILPRSTSRFEYLAFFIGAGLLSSLVSHVYSVRILAPRLSRAAATPITTRQAILPSLGSSGAIYGCLAVTALAYPDAQVSLIFLPFIPMSIGAATGGMIALDLVGLIRGWRLFDHSAHIGGAAAGILYYLLGHLLFEKLRLGLRLI